MKQKQGNTVTKIKISYLRIIFTIISTTCIFVSNQNKGGDETDSVVYSKALEKIDFTELRSFHQEREQRRQQELEEVSLKIKVNLHSDKKTRQRQIHDIDKS